MKIIDLLNKIAKGEETLPKQIKWNNSRIYEWNEKLRDYQLTTSKHKFFLVANLDSEDLNDEIEIVEDKEDKLKRLVDDLDKFIRRREQMTTHEKNFYGAETLEIIRERFNDIIDLVNKN